MLLRLIACAQFADRAGEMKFILLLVGPKNYGKTTLAYLILSICSKIVQLPHAAISASATEAKRSAAHKQASGARVALVEDFSNGKLDAAATKMFGTGADVATQNQWTGVSQKLRMPFLVVTLNPEHMPPKPHMDERSKVLVMDATKGHMQNLAESVALDMDVVRNVHQYGGAMAFLALRELTGGSATFTINGDLSTYVPQSIKDESKEWDVGGLAEAPADVVEAYKQVVVPLPSHEEKYGVAMGTAVTALHEHSRTVLEFVCNHEEATISALLQSKQAAAAREALARLHSRAYPGSQRWTDYSAVVELPNGKSGKTPGAPLIAPGKYLSSWALRGFKIADEGEAGAGEERGS